MKHLKTTLLAAGTSALLMLSMTAHADSEREIEQELAVADGGQVRFKIIDGDVSFKTWNKDLVKIKGHLGKKSDELIFKADGVDSIIKVESKGHNYYGKNGYNHGGGNTELEITMPENSQLFAQSTSGDFEIDGVKGGVKAKNVSGDIEISNSSKSIEAYSSSGDIVLNKCSGEIHVETVSGELDANVDSDRFEASTISGDIDLVMGKTDRVEVTSVSGDLDLQLELNKHGSIEASTVSGDVDLVFNQKDVNARFDIVTGPGGEIENGLTDDRPETSWVQSEMLEFKVGKGEGHVELETVSGSVAVRKR
ncbi:MAG: DUF4097 family beta strand repeat-containing protein [Arenicella sp.]|jgi:DUF4097 and DUF4098 domain-containing protein YvlB|nr:DUF4097 family beta strand repeat-containing protein [Arenicella sp.]